MNHSTAVFLINDAIRAIMVTYEAEKGSPKTMFKTLDESLKVDDYVIVPTNTRHKMTICKVSDVDVDVDFDSATPVDWIIGRVDRDGYDKTVGMEASAIDAIRSAEKTRKKKELLKDLNLDQNEKLKALPIANGAALEGPKA